MTSAPRLPRPRTRVGHLVAVLGLLVALALGIAAAPAGAVIVTSETLKSGVQPRNETYVLDGNGPTVTSFANAGGAPIVSSSKVYAIYWDPTDTYHGDWQQQIDTFLQSMGASSGSLANVFAVDAQYTDRANQHATYDATFEGSYTDTDPYPTAGCADPEPLHLGDAITCLSNQEIRAELQTFIAQHSLPKGMGTIFYLLTPPGVTVCLDGGGPTGHCSDFEALSATSYENSFCSYHSDITSNPSNGDANTILYGMIPWTAGGLGDYDLRPEDRTAAFACQDGGFDPSSDPIEKKEKKKEKTEKQEQELKEKTLEEQQKQKELEFLEGPHQEEPNQPAGRSPDGGYDTGLADLIVNQIASEQQNIVTDPLLNAWHDSAGLETTDECRNFFASGSLNGSVSANEHSGSGTLENQLLGAGSYYVNTAFDLAALKIPYPGVPCLGGLDLVPQFTSPNPINAAEIVGFDGMESDITLDAGTGYSASGEAKNTYPTYKWNFGDGTPEVVGFAPGAPTVNSPAATPCPNTWEPPCAGSAFHAYQYGGTYQVTLTVIDTAGNESQVIHTVTVNGPAAPTAGGGETAGSPSHAALATPPAAAPAAPTTPAAPGPVAKAAAVASSLKQVARKGLEVHYTVNEQVAGHFEVLLNASTARSLGIGGHPASGLPAGFPKSLVIGHALLVTTKGGHSSVRIKFSKSTAKRLRRARSVKLTLRLVVHNASATNPLFTTVMSEVVLHR